MAKFNLGDTVRITSLVGSDIDYDVKVGEEFVVSRVVEYSAPDDVDNKYYGYKMEGRYMVEKQLELVTIHNQINTMEKYYRLKKDLPGSLAGCVVKKDGDGYSPINDLFDTDAVDEGQEIFYSGYTIEHAPDWWERVYPINLITKTVYKLKEEAKEYFAKEQTA